MEKAESNHIYTTRPSPYNIKPVVLITYRSKGEGGAKTGVVELRKENISPQIPLLLL